MIDHHGVAEEVIGSREMHAFFDTQSRRLGVIVPGIVVSESMTALISTELAIEGRHQAAAAQIPCSTMIEV